MKPIAWLFKWILKAAIFFTLFAFALNNQSDVTVRFFFGQQWTAPMVLVVLGAFAGGLLVGVLGMVPRWWRQRRRTQEVTTTPAAAAPASKPADLTENGYNGANIHGI
jgi:lipopolysaccharide assembly protein A